MVAEGAREAGNSLRIFRPHTIYPLVFLLCSLIFLRPLTLNPTYVPFQPEARYSDLLISHLPNAAYIRDSLARYGQWPLWNGQILAGQPFAADPLAGLWYPPNLLLLIPGLPLTVGFNLLLAIHLAWAGWGLFAFLQADGTGKGAALLGGMAFMGTPKLVAHLAAGHVSLVYAVAWTPWLMLTIKKAAGGSLRHGALAGACLASIFLADVRWAFYAGVLGAAFWAAASIKPRNKLSAAKALPAGRAGSIGRNLTAVMAGMIIFVLLTAVLALPLVEFVGLSNRRGLTLNDAGELSLPPIYLLGLLIRDPHGYHEYMTYAGLAPLVLALGGIFRRRFFWIAAAITAALFSLGVNFPLFAQLFPIVPFMSLLRVPPRAWFVTALAICILAAHGLDFLAMQLKRTAASSGRPAVVTPLTLICLFFTFADLQHSANGLLIARPLPAPPPAAQWLAAQPGLFRVYSPSYSLPAGSGLQNVDGVSPLQLASAAEFIERAAGVSADGYSVTVPAFTNGDPAVANADAVPDINLLGMLNVLYVAAEFPLEFPGLELTRAFGTTRVYTNTAFRPRAWVEPDSLDEPSGDKSPDCEWSPNSIRVQAAGPGLLVLSEVMYPGWTVKIDGAPAVLETIDGLWRGVHLDSGDHVVLFEFRPRSVYIGGALTVTGVLPLGWLMWYSRKDHRRERNANRGSSVTSGSKEA